MKSRFQFRLRTLLIGVAVVAVVCAFVRWHYDFVCQRKVMMHRIEVEDHGSVEVHFTPVKFEETKPLPWFRRVLGDSAITDIALPADTPASERAAIRAMFPEARLWAFKKSIADELVLFPDEPTE